MYSFKKNINHALIVNDLNNFNYYFGAQIFEDWGLKSMVRLVTKTNYNNSKIFVASSEIIKQNNTLSFSISKDLSENSYRKKIKEKIILPDQNVFILTYDSVFKEGFRRY